MIFMLALRTVTDGMVFPSRPWGIEAAAHAALQPVYGTRAANPAFASR